MLRMLPSHCTRKVLFQPFACIFREETAGSFKRNVDTILPFGKFQLLVEVSVCQAESSKGWAEGAGATPRCSLRALILGRARLAGCRAAGRLPERRYLLQIWDLLKCVCPDASPCSNGLCVCACPVIPWSVLEVGAACGIVFTPVWHRGVG